MLFSCSYNIFHVDNVFYVCYNSNSKEVNSLNERIRELRVNLGLSREEFAQQLGLKSRGKIENIELGRTVPDDSFIKLICTTYNANYEWVMSGTGEMFNPLTRNQVITDFAGDLMKEEDGNFKKRLIEALAKLDESEWIVLEKLATQLSKKEPGENP